MSLGDFRASEAVSGTSAWIRYSDNVLVGSEVGSETARYKLTFGKLRYGHREPVEVHRSQGPNGFTGRFYLAPWKPRTVTEQRFKDVIALFPPGEQVVSRAVQEALELSPDKVSRLMAGVVAQGCATRIKRGVWKMTEPNDPQEDT